MNTTHLPRIALALLFLGLAVFAVQPAAATPIVQADISQDNYGAICTGLWVYPVAPGYSIECVGSPVTGGGPCLVWIDNTWVLPQMCI